MSIVDKILSNPQLWESLSHTPIKCPECGKVSDSIKCYSLPGLWISLLFYLHYESKKHMGCPKCIRKKIFLKGFTYNIITGNVYWLIMIVPWMICQFARSFTNGHSDEITEMLFDNFKNAQKN